MLLGFATAHTKNNEKVMVSRCSRDSKKTAKVRHGWQD